MDKVKTLKAGDPNFHFVNGISMSPRAGFEISNGCPDVYKDILLECINRKWLKPVAYMKESEYVWEKLQDQ